MCAAASVLDTFSSFPNVNSRFILLIYVVAATIVVVAAVRAPFRDKCSCEYGKYAPQALTESCLTCSLGSATNGNRNATSCTACDAGSFSGSLPTSRCLLCAAGQWAPSGQQACSLCEAGSFADLEGASVCTKCAAGYATAVVAAAQGGAEAATPYLGSVTCQECVVGRFQGRTGATLCQEVARLPFTT